MIEKWVDIPNLEGWYQASSEGRIRSVERTIARGDGRREVRLSRTLKGQKRSDGYRVMLSINGKKKFPLMHSLIMSAFYREMANKGLWVNHIDGNKENNALSNLEYTSPREIHLRSTRVIHADKYKRVIQYDLATGATIKEYSNASQAAEELNCNGGRSSISKCCRGIKKHFKGYGWRYAD